MNALSRPGNTDEKQEGEVRTPMTTELSASFAGGAYAAATARRALGGLGDLVSHRRLDDIALLVSELVTNSVRHGGADEDDRLELSAHRDGDRLRIEVADRGPGFDPGPALRRADDEIGGWGLILVERLADRWGVDRDDDATVVWFELSVPGRARRGGAPARQPVLNAAALA
jgi:anti-sigma regulatory factor (Ser/Thr protein kinase)